MAEGRTKRAWRVSIALIACGTAIPIRVAGAESEVATLGIDTERDAHVYVRGPAGSRLAALCTGQCEVRLAPGTYRIEAGFSHSRLVGVREPLMLASGEVANLHVEVRDNATAKRLTVGSVAVMIAGLVALVVACGKQGNMERIPRDAVATGGLIALGGGAVGASFAFPGLKGPSVGAHRWTIPVKEDGT
jgi:hypothetical protein